MSTIGSPGWYPDPTGRHEHRWWDGTSWTGMISTEGSVGEDLIGPAIAPSDQAMLRAGSLAIDFTTTGMRGSGVWRVYDRVSSRDVGRMTIDHGGPADRAAYAAFDSNGRMVFSLSRPSRVGHLTLLVRDHQGMLVGRIVAQGSRVSLMAPVTADPQSPEGVWATSFLPGRAPVGTRPQPMTGAQLVRSDRTPFGALRIDKGGSGQLASEVTPSWFYLDRAPDVPEPLRTLTVAYVPFMALLLGEARGRPPAGSASS